MPRAVDSFRANHSAYSGLLAAICSSGARQTTVPIAYSSISRSHSEKSPCGRPGFLRPGIASRNSWFFHVLMLIPIVSRATCDTDCRCHHHNPIFR